MKAIAVLFVLSCLSLCYVSAVEKTQWGILNGRILGKETIVADGAPSQYQIRAFAYPTIANKKDPIIGIRHLDYAGKTNLTFIHGGVYRKDVAILLKSARGKGINSEIIFYGM